MQRSCPGHKEVTNFGPALKDCSVYAQLLAAVCPESSELKSRMEALPQAASRLADGGFWRLVSALCVEERRRRKGKEKGGIRDLNGPGRSRHWA